VPSQTKLFGTVETPPHLKNNNATCTFWRSIENLEISGGKFHWAVSQAAPIRRMKVNVPAEFDWGGWSSGGYTGDSMFADNTGSWSQQQWYARNSHFAAEFYGVNWNKVMQGSTGIIADSNWDPSCIMIGKTANTMYLFRRSGGKQKASLGRIRIRDPESL